MTQNYLIARCRANLENRAERQIKRDRGEAIVPRINSKIIRNGRVIDICSPLIREYLFLKRKVRYSPFHRDWRYLIVNGQIAKVAAHEVERLEKICIDLDKPVKTCGKLLFKRGQRVRINYGIIGRNHEIGKFCGYIRNGKRARVLINGVMFALKSERLEAAPV